MKYQNENIGKKRFKMKRSLVLLKEFINYEQSKERRR